MSELARPRRVLLVRLSAIGDCIHALPLVSALRQQWPDLFLGWAIERAGHELLRGHPGVDHFHLFPRRASPSQSPWARFQNLLSFRRELREQRYDVAIDVQGLTKSGLAAKWSGAPIRVGFSGVDSRELNRWFVNRRQSVPSECRHVVDRNLSLLEALGVPIPALARFELPEYALEPEVGAFLDSGFAGRSFIVVNPGTTWPTKRWQVSSFVRLSADLAERAGLPVLVTWGTPEERDQAQRVAEGAKPAEVVVAPRLDLRQLAAVLLRARLFVGNDTGPMHLAVAVKTPTVAVFGATDPARNGPYGNEHRVVTTAEELDCRPCCKAICARADLACLVGLGPDRVLDACMELLNRYPKNKEL